MAKNRAILSPGLQGKLGEAHIGVDEAGRGCMAGPVCAGAVYTPEGFDFSVFSGLTDSKKLNAAKRDELERLIKSAPGLIWAIGMAWPGEIDRVNILNATFRAMSRAAFCVAAQLARQQQPEPAQNQAAATLDALPVLIDGPHSIPLPQWRAARKKTVPPMPRMHPVIKGDSLVPAISAASILAKVHRDRLMAALARRWPLYGFEKHKGYGTKEHMDLINMHGPSPQHRLSFGAPKNEEQLTML